MTQWQAPGQAGTGGDAGIAEALYTCWVDRAHWTPLLRRLLCSAMRMDFVTLDGAAGLIAAGFGARPGPAKA